MHKVCAKCERKYRFVYKVNDIIWDRLVPEKYQRKDICIECFLEYLNELKYPSFNINFDDDDLEKLGIYSNKLLVDDHEDRVYTHSDTDTKLQFLLKDTDFQLTKLIDYSKDPYLSKQDKVSITYLIGYYFKLFYEKFK